MRSGYLAVALCALAATTVASAQAAVPPPTVLPISAYAIERNGTVVGIDSAIHVVTWKAGVVRSLGFTGLPFASAPGWVAGNLIGVDPNQGFRWHAGVRQTLPPLPGWNGSWAAAVNAHGVVVGHSIKGVDSHATLWRDGVPEDLVGPFDGFSEAIDVNAAGDVIGAALDGATGIQQALLWHAGARTVLAGVSVPLAINARGDIAGLGLFGKGVLWRRGRVTDLGTLPGTDSSFARGIDAGGHVVGSSRLGTDAVHDRATLWTRSTGLVELPALDGYAGCDANRIGGGLVLGSCNTSDSRYVSVVWDVRSVLG